MQSQRTKKMAVLALLSALGYLAVLLIHVPVAGFLTYDPKDAFTVLAGLIYGPPAAVVVAVVVALVEMLTISTTGPFGMFMNLLASASFAGTASLVYQRSGKKKLLPALLCGSIALIVAMLLCNWLLSPYYFGMSRQAVEAMLLPVFLPFNAVKGVLNTVIGMLLLPPLQKALKKAGGI